MRLKQILIPAFLFLFVGSMYVHNLSRSVYGGDAGDFITAAVLGGVAHPPGYPLFTFLGFLLTRLPFFSTPAFAVGLISSFAGVGGVILFYFISKLLTKSTLISIISSLTLAFTYFFWFYSEIAEVFVLNGFFFLSLLYITLRITREKKFSLFPLFFFVLGLSLTNHQTIIFTFPSFILLFIPTIFQWFKKRKISFLFILKNILTFILGFAIYLYVPIASSHNPALNWDHVNDIATFLHLFFRKDYGTFSAGFFTVPSFLQRLIIVKTYLLQLVIQLTIPVITLCLLGFGYLLKKNVLLCLSLLLGFFISGPLFIGYAGFPLTGSFYFGVNERFFLLSLLFLLLYAPFGLAFISEVFKKILGRSPLLIQSVFLLIPIMLLFYNFPKTNLATIFIGDYYAQDILAPLAPHSILFLAGDTILFNTWYVHYGEQVRPDVRLVNINGNIGSPYFTVLEQKYKNAHPHASTAQITDGIMKSLPTNGTVFGVEALDTPSDTTWIPYGLVLQYIKTSNMPTEEMFTTQEDKIWSTLHVPKIHQGDAALAYGNLTISEVPVSYANAMLLIGNFYLSQYKDTKKAEEWFKRATVTSPEYDKAYSALGAYYLLNGHDCLLAEINLKKALALNPVGALNYLLLYSTYVNCQHSPVKAKAVAQSFEKRFDIPFSKALKNIAGEKINKK